MLKDPQDFDPQRRWRFHPDRACRGVNTETFFAPGRPGAPSANTKQRWQAVKERYCFRCPVMYQCRDGTLGESYGIFGGLDQDERAKARGKLAKETRAWGMDVRLAWGKILYGLRYELDDRGRRVDRMTWRRITEVTGFTEPAASRMLADYEQHLKWLAARKAAEKTAAADELPEIPFPERGGERDLWVRHDRMTSDANYKGHNEDGTSVLVEIRGLGGVSVRKWASVEDVRFHRDMPHVIAFTEVSYGDEGRRSAA